MKQDKKYLALLKDLQALHKQVLSVNMKVSAIYKRAKHGHDKGKIEKLKCHIKNI